MFWESITIGDFFFCLVLQLPLANTKRKQAKISRTMPRPEHRLRSTTIGGLCGGAGGEKVSDCTGSTPNMTVTFFLMGTSRSLANRTWITLNGLRVVVPLGLHGPANVNVAAETEFVGHDLRRPLSEFVLCGN